MNETSNSSQKQKQRAPYTAPNIQSEPLFETKALESAGKNFDACLAGSEACAADGCPESGS